MRKESKEQHKLYTEVLKRFSDKGILKSVILIGSWRIPLYKKYFKELYGEKLKSAPRGFPKDFAELELLKYKHYAVLHTVPDSFWTHKDLETNISNIFRSQFQLNRFIKSAIGG